MSAKQIWFFSPVYLDVESFLILKKNLVAAAAGLTSVPLRFVVIDDTGGFDREILKLKDHKDVSVLTAPFNLGHQRALVYGLRTFAKQISDEDFVVTIDSDGEDKPEDLGRLLDPLMKDKDNLRKISLARRTKRRESIVFKTMYFFFKILFRSMTGVLIRTGNYAAFRGWTTRNILFHPHFDLSYSSSLISLNLDATYVPCERAKRYAGESRMSYLKLLMHGVRMLMPFLDRIAMRALVGFSALLGLGILLSVGLVAARFLAGFATPDWAYVTLVLLLSLSFIALGNFVILFAIFSQSQGLALRGMEGGHYKDGT